MDPEKVALIIGGMSTYAQNNVVIMEKYPTVIDVIDDDTYPFLIDGD